MVMTQAELADTLRVDEGVARAFVELVRIASPDGTVSPESHGIDPDALARLTAWGILGRDAGTGDGQSLRFAADLWAEFEPQRDALHGDFQHAVRILLDIVERRSADADGTGSASPVLPGGSTLSARGLVKVFRKRRVVNEVDLHVSQGEIVGLLGPNGAGKTTTFYMIVGLISPDQGDVYLDDVELTGVPMYRRARRGIGYLAQEPSVFRKLTVEENILAILETMPLSRAQRKERLETLLDELSIKHLRKSKAYALSGGERRRLEITRALVSDPKFMLLDEPFAGVDPIAVHDIQQIVAGLRHRGIGVVITDHNVEQTLDIVDRAYIMYDGRVRVSGTVAELVWNDEVAEIYFGPTLTARMRERYRRPEVA
jgi:lipopolysaccharide export system ATP-binding protein